MISNSEIILFDYLTTEELSNGSHPDAYTINSIINWATKKGKSVEYKSYSDFGFYGLMASFARKTNTRTDVSRKGNINYLFTGIFYIFSYFVSRIDFPMRVKINELLNLGNSKKTIILSYPYLVHTFKKIVANHRMGAEIVLLEHNIEEKYLKFNMQYLSSRNLGQLILQIIEKIEREAIDDSDAILVVSNKDKNSIQKISGGKEIQVVSKPDRIPYFELSSPIFEPSFLKLDFRPAPTALNILFLGSNTRMNYESVKCLISLSNMLKDVSAQLNIFIVGNVFRQFIGSENLPHNVHFIGYVNKLQDVLTYADLFFLSDKMGTGFEVKAYAYESYDRPIVVLMERGNRIENEYKGNGKNQYIYATSLQDIANLVLRIIQIRLKRRYSTLFKIPLTYH